MLSFEFESQIYNTILVTFTLDRKAKQNPQSQLNKQQYAIIQLKLFRYIWCVHGNSINVLDCQKAVQTSK